MASIEKKLCSGDLQGLTQNRRHREISKHAKQFVKNGIQIWASIPLRVVCVKNWKNILTESPSGGRKWIIRLR